MQQRSLKAVKNVHIMTQDTDIMVFALRRLTVLGLQTTMLMGTGDNRGKILLKPIYEELVSKTSYIHPRHVTHLHYWLPFAIKIVPSLIKYVPTVGYFLFDVLHNVYKVIKSGNEWQAGVDRRGFGTKQDFIPLFFFMYAQNLWQGEKAVFTIVELNFLISAVLNFK